jgi:hypothetical protein
MTTPGTVTVIYSSFTAGSNCQVGNGTVSVDGWLDM